MRNFLPSNWRQTALSIDPEETIQDIIRLIHDCFKSLNRRYAILGLSGGLDSSLASILTVKSLGKERVLLYYLPEHDSKPIHRQHAHLIAKQMDLPLQQIKITPALRSLGVYNLLPLRFLPTQKLKSHAVDYARKRLIGNSLRNVLSFRLSSSGGSWLARSSAYISSKHRMRMVVLYLEAERQRGMVVGAANRTEWMTGTFTHWGCDHCSDVMPLLHLYRSQLPTIANYLNIPKEIVHKKADPDVLPGLDDKGELLGSFEIADQILWGLENGISRGELEDEFGLDQVSNIHTLVESSTHYRDTPYSLL